MLPVTNIARLSPPVNRSTDSIVSRKSSTCRDHVIVVINLYNKHFLFIVKTFVNVEYKKCYSLLPEVLTRYILFESSFRIHQTFAIINY